MTRTAKTPRLMSHYAESFCEIHPEDAEDAGVAPATLVRIVTPQGTVIVRALVTERQQKGSIFVPMHWTDQQTAQGRIGAATLAAVDPVSGQPGLKFSGARIEPFDVAWYGFAVLRNRPETIPADYWAIAQAEGGWRIELAGAEPVEDWADFAADLIGAARTWRRCRTAIRTRPASGSRPSRVMHCWARCSPLRSRLACRGPGPSSA